MRQYLSPPDITGILTLFLPPSLSLISSPQKVEYTAFFGNHTFIPQRLRQLLLEVTQTRSVIRTFHTSIRSSACVQQCLEFTGIRSKQTSLIIHHKGWLGRGSTVLPRSQKVYRFDLAQKIILKLLRWESWSTQISTQSVQFKVVKANNGVRVQFRQFFHIGQFLCTGDEDDVHVHVFNWFDDSSRSSTKETHKGLFGFEEAFIAVVGATEGGHLYAGVGVSGNAGSFEGDVHFGFVRKEDSDVFGDTVFIVVGFVSCGIIIFGGEGFGKVES
mmetsp:Transcript_22226/g.32463  ORF Transcript_22226/g.32463 Transcript_22226/m.32463 type:complete len:273 (-) Transcript_22226:405-1223(-)